MSNKKVLVEIVGWADIGVNEMVISGDAQKAYDEYVGVIDADNVPRVAYDSAGFPYDPVTEISVIRLIDEYRK